MDIRLGLSDGVVEILRHDALEPSPDLAASAPDLHVGMGLAIASNRIVTCAHVVVEALDCVDPLTTSDPERWVLIRYTHSADRCIFRAKLVKMPNDWSGGNDCALLETEKPVPDDVGLAILGAVDPDLISDDRLCIFGKSEAYAVGRIVNARFMARVGSGYSQIIDENQAGTLVTGGYSGAGVWNRDKACFIGLLTARDPRFGARSSFLVPTGSILRTLGELPHEKRDVTGTNQRAWIAASLITFVLGLAHHLQSTSRSIDTGIIPWAENDPTLASYFGLHITAFLLPLVLSAQISHARAFSLHVWYQRVPYFWSTNPMQSLAATRLSATLTLLFLLFAPIYGHWHFVNQVTTEGAIGTYVRTVPHLYEQFCGGELASRCTEFGGRFTSPEFGPFILIEGIPWQNNGYHFGERDFKNTVTFFPILQPLILIAMSVLQLILLAILLNCTFRRSPTEASRTENKQP